MQLLSVKALCGPNVWGRASMLEACVDVSAWHHLAAGDGQAVQRRLAACLPGWTSRAAVSRETEIAGALRDVALVLQTLVGTPVSLGGIGAISASGTVDVAIEYEEERLGRACLDAAQRICVAALAGQDPDAAAELRTLRALAEDVCFGRATGPLVAAARAREIPFRRLDDESLVQLGHGGRQRRIRTAVTDRTGKIAEWISLDKDLSKRLLAELGLPVPVGRPVTSAEDAWATACELGIPVVVKPRSADYGHGIGLNLRSREQVFAAYAAAREYREDVLVERFAAGSQYRITVVGHQMVAAVRREPVRLLGDGQHTIAQLIELANLDPRRGDDLRLPLERVSADDDTVQVLAEQGFGLDTIVPAGVEVVLSRIAHSWAGAGVTDVTDLVHPRVAAQCVRAARLIGLDVAGLDVVAEDISRPLEDQDGVILEVNAEPTIAFHFPPLCDRYRPVCEAIIESLFPNGQDGRIPLAIVSGCGDRREVGGWLAWLLRPCSQGIGRASSDGLHFDNERAKAGDQSNLAGTRAALLCPDVDIAVLERDLASIRHEGLGLDRVDAVILTRLSPGLDAEWEQAARTLVATVDPKGVVVIEADDAQAAALTMSFPGTVVVVSASDVPLSCVGHGQACTTVCLRGQNVIIATPAGEHRMKISKAVERSHSGGLLAAVGAAWAMGVPMDEISTRIDSAIQTGKP